MMGGGLGGFGGWVFLGRGAIGEGWLVGFGGLWGVFVVLNFWGWFGDVGVFWGGLRG